MDIYINLHVDHQTPVEHRDYKHGGSLRIGSSENGVVLHLPPHCTVANALAAKKALEACFAPSVAPTVRPAAAVLSALPAEVA